MSYAHLYIHGLNDSEHFPLEARVTFYERPPGSIAVVTLISLLTSLILAMFAGLAHGFITKDARVASSVTALLLPFPATAAFWLQPSFGNTDFLSVPLASRIGLIVTGLLSFIGAIVINIAGLLSPLSKFEAWTIQLTLIVMIVLSIITTVILVTRMVRGYKIASEPTSKSMHKKRKIKNKI